MTLKKGVPFLTDRVTNQSLPESVLAEVFPDHLHAYVRSYPALTVELHGQRKPITPQVATSADNRKSEFVNSSTMTSICNSAAIPSTSLCEEQPSQYLLDRPCKRTPSSQS